jgi:hypothetical protein
VDEGAKVALRGLDDEVVVVWHENKGVKDDTGLVNAFRQIEEKFFVIPMGQENPSPLISPCGNMAKGAFKNNTQGPCHREFQGMDLAPPYLKGCPV